MIKFNSIDDVMKYGSENKFEGLYQMPDEVYFDSRCPGVTRSRLNQMTISPKYYKIQEIDDTQKESEAMRFGSMFHEAMEDWKKFDRTYHIAPPFIGPRGGALKGDKLLEAVKSWESEHKCKAISKEEKNKVEMMRNIVNNNPSFKEYFPNPKHEVVAFASDPRYNILLKCKVDLLQYFGDDYYLLGDFKSCEPKSIASHYAIQSMIKSEKYPLYYQYCFYRYIFNLLGYDNDFKFLFIEKDLPFGFRIVSLEPGWYEYGMEILFRDIALLNECQKENIWPDYETEIEIQLPFYLRSDR